MGIYMQNPPFLKASVGTSAVLEIEPTPTHSCKTPILMVSNENSIPNIYIHITTSLQLHILKRWGVEIQTTAQYWTQLFSSVGSWSQACALRTISSTRSLCVTTASWTSVGVKSTLLQGVMFNSHHRGIGFIFLIIARAGSLRCGRRVIAV